MATIMIFGSIGLCAAVGIDFANKDFKTKADLYKTTLVEGKKEILKEQVKEELKDKDRYQTVYSKEFLRPLQTHLSPRRALPF